MKKQQAAVMEGKNRLNVKEIPVPEIKEDEVLVKVKACSVCGSDINSLRTGLYMSDLPTVMGHEVSGIVVEKGDDVNGLEIGDHVALEPNIPCRKCKLCQKGLYHLCKNTEHIGNDNDGGFAEYVKIQYLNAYKISKEIPFEEAALMEPVGVCLEAIRRSRLGIGEKVLIIGNGPFGLIFIQLAKLAGAGEIYVSGRREHRNKIAKSYGATVINAIKDNEIDKIMEYTSQEGVDVVIDAAGTPSVFELAVKAAAPRGRVILFSHTVENVNFDITPVQMKELELLGSVNNPCTFEVVAELLRTKKIDLDDIITHKFTLNEIHEAMQIAENKEDNVLKAVVVFNE